MKLVLLLAGAGAGISGTALWLLGEPTGEQFDSLPAMLRMRWQAARVRLDEALEEGRIQGLAAEERLKAELLTYRKGKNSAS